MLIFINITVKSWNCLKRTDFFCALYHKYIIFFVNKYEMTNIYNEFLVMYS